MYIFKDIFVCTNRKESVVECEPEKSKSNPKTICSFLNLSVNGINKILFLIIHSISVVDDFFEIEP